MELYLGVARIGADEQVNITTMYLSSDAKLWWRTQIKDDLNVWRPKIETWDCLKQELKEQFLPNNMSWLAREDLKKLKQDKSVRDYVKDFSSLILDIENMSEEDKLFNFMSGLQPWAQAELRRQNVKDLPSAIAAADSLVDFKIVTRDGSTVVPSKFKTRDKRDEKRKKKNFGGEGYKPGFDKGKGNQVETPTSRMQVVSFAEDHTMQENARRRKG
jgi:hypothetical protein